MIWLNSPDYPPEVASPRYWMSSSTQVLLQSIIPSALQSIRHITNSRITTYFSIIDLYLRQQIKARTIGNLQYSTPRGIIWAGIAFELVCFNHIYQIAKALDIRSIFYTYSPWRYTDSNKGAQIDLVIDRADGILNLCEIKFSKGTFTITKSYAESLRNKIQALASHKSAKKKTVLLTFIASHGISKNEYSDELVENVVGMDDLFYEVIQ